MAITLEEVTKSAMQLSSHQRLALAGLLLEASDFLQDSTIDPAWNQEIQNRIQAIDSGDVSGIPYQDVMRAADHHLSS